MEYSFQADIFHNCHPSSCANISFENGVTGTRWKTPDRVKHRLNWAVLPVSLWDLQPQDLAAWVALGPQLGLPHPPTWLCGLGKQLQGATRQRHQLVLTAAKAAQQRLEAMQRAVCASGRGLCCPVHPGDALKTSLNSLPQSCQFSPSSSYITLFQAPPFP